MRNLLNFLLRYNNLIVFLILEGISLILVTGRNEYHNSRMVKAMTGITRGMNERISNARNYLNLRDINYNLASENALLKNRLIQFERYDDNSRLIQVNDTINNQEFQYTSAKVINNSVNKQKNYFTINKGTLQGIKVDMAVTSGNSAAGIIVGCSDNFSVAISLLNLDFRISARIKTNGYFGSLSWDGHSYRNAVLNDIPQHIDVSIGDTIETTSYSAIFPEGIGIGTVTEVKPSGSDFYFIKVGLFTDFKKLAYIDVIGSLKRNERLGLENQFQ